MDKNTPACFYSLQPDNVLVISNGKSRVKIADFGFSCRSCNSCRQPEGYLITFCHSNYNSKAVCHFYLSCVQHKSGFD